MPKKSGGLYPNSCIDSRWILPVQDAGGARQGLYVVFDEQKSQDQ
jgi:hypothetical protein